jgi:ABC-type transport system involved in multi-copper enzyme maturation permease subunit
MTVLFAVEVRRMLARRLVLVFVLLALAGIALAAIIVAVNSRPPSASVIASAKRQQEQALTSCERDAAANPQGYGVPPGESPGAFCRHELPLESFYGDTRFHLSSLRDVFLGTSFILSVGALVLGASFMGAEWHAGTLATLLTWEPRRLRVFIAKLIAMALVVFLLAVAVQLILGLVLAAVAAVRGTTEGTGAAWLRSVTGVAFRSAGLAVMASVLGFAIATIGRNTAAALGVAFVYLAVAERLIGALRPHWQPWLIGDNSLLFLNGEDNRFPPLNRSMLAAAGLLGTYTLILIVVALVVFRRRDVT